MSIASERRALVERTFPGITCSRVAFEIHRFDPSNSTGDVLPDRCKYWLQVCVKGSAELLIAHQLVARAEIDGLPPSGKIYGLQRLPDGTYQASVSWHDSFDYDNRQLMLEGRDMAARVGIAHVQKEVSHSKKIRGQRVSWHTRGDVIHPNWQLLQEQTQRQRRMAEAQSS